MSTSPGTGLAVGVAAGGARDLLDLDFDFDLEEEEEEDDDEEAGGL